MKLIDVLYRLFVRSMSCRYLRILSKCGPDAAKFTQTFSELISESLPKVFDAIYFKNGVTPLYINDCNNIKKRNVLFKYYLCQQNVNNQIVLFLFNYREGFRMLF